MRLRSRVRHGWLGAALLEVLIGLTILASAGVSSVALLRQMHESITLIRARESEYDLANEQLTKMMIWSPNDFLVHVGRNRERGLVFLLEQAGPALFIATIADSARGAPLLTTTFYVNDTRPDEESINAARR